MQNNLRKVFGIISYFPDADTDYHKYVREQRMRRCSELLQTLNRLWFNVDIMVIAQNWQDYKPPINLTAFNYESKLGILTARKVLRQKFLESDYDYLIMLDDDAVIKSNDPEAFMREIDSHPDGFGVVRRMNHALNLCAISRYIYSQMDLPDIDVEKGEGFGDDVFVAQCFARYPEKSFDFPDDCIRDTSLKSQLPSTWRAESVVNMKYLCYVTDALLIDASRKPLETATEPAIDAVIPYVDVDDLAWQEDFRDAVGASSMVPNRYRSWGTLQYLFRGIAEYMPYIKTVFLIVARDSQVPAWLNRENVRVVYHKDFIPEEFLPTFNSCTIESFLYRIKDLSEHFVYFNDDIFPINPSSPSDFFTGDRPHLRFRVHFNYDPHHTFRCQCRAGMDLITNMLGADPYPRGEIISLDHSIFPILKSSAQRVGEACTDAIRQSISSLRQPKNLNQYMYHYYQYFTEAYVEDFCPYVYMEVSDSIDMLRQIVNIDKIKFVCLNDMSDLTNYEAIRDDLQSILGEKFPNSCKYEVRDD